MIEEDLLTRVRQEEAVDDTEEPATWEFSTMPDDYTEELTTEHVFLGPVAPPEVPIPLAPPRVPKYMAEVKVEVPPLVQLLPLPKLIPIKR